MTERAPVTYENFEHVREIRTTHKFAAFEVVVNGRRAFLKRPVQDEFKERLQNEARGALAMKQLDPHGASFYIPEVLEIADSHILTEWINGNLMKEHFMSSDRALVHHDLEMLVDIFHLIDERTPETEPTIVQDRARQSIAKVNERLSALKFQEHLDASLVEQVTIFLSNQVDALQGKATHGDLTPGNIMVDPTRTVPVIVDFETYRDDWPRHYNAVNFAFNYLERHPEFSTEIKDAFYRYCGLAGIDPSKDVAALSYTAGLRGLQMIVERLSGDGLTESTRTYIEDAMQNILAGKLFLAEKQTTRQAVI